MTSTLPLVGVRRMAFAEAWAIARENGWQVEFTTAGTVRIVSNFGHGYWLGEGATWAEAFSRALGVQVEPVDEADLLAGVLAECASDLEAEVTSCYPESRNGGGAGE